MNKEESNAYQREWRKNNPKKIKAIRTKSEARPERKEYLRNWQRTSPNAKVIRRRFNKSDKRKEYDKRWIKENPDKVKAKFKRYYNSTKGIVNYLKKRDKKKFKFINDEITMELIDVVNQRDTSCVYCHKALRDIKKEYDHLNPFKPFSKFNMVKCCKTCNRRKNNADVFAWSKFMNYKPSQIVYDLHQYLNKEDS